LSSEQKSSLKTLRVARDDKGSKGGKVDTRAAAQLLTTLVDKINLANNDDSQEEVKENEQDAGNPNRNHSALKKPKRGTGP
jgi:hypothetical protein